MGRLVLGLLLVLLVGCSSMPAKVEYKFVNKPVLVCPPPSDMNNGQPVPMRPDLVIFELTKESSAGEVARAYELTVKQLQGQANILSEIIMGYDDTSKEYERIKIIMDALYPNNETIQPDK